MAITRTDTPGNGRVHQIASGAFFDDAASPAVLTVSPGFRPRYFRLENATDRIAFEWMEGMAATNSIKTVAAGTRTLDTTSAIVPDAGVAGTTTNGLVNSPPGVAAGGDVVIAAANILQNKQYFWYALG